MAVVLAAVFAWTAAVAEEPAPPGEAAREPAPAAVGQEDEDWLNTVWVQVDEMVQQQDHQAQETVTVAGVRGAEAEDDLLEKLYYKGGRRYPSQDKLRQAIETLTKAIEQSPDSPEVPKQRFFVAQCHEKLGQTAEAVAQYRLVARSYPDTRWAEKSQSRIAELSSGE